MSIAPGTRTSAIHPLSAERIPCRILGEVFRPNASDPDIELLVRVEFDRGGRYRVDLEDVTDYE